MAQNASIQRGEANNVNVTRGKRGISALGAKGTTAILDQSMQSDNATRPSYSLLRGKGAHVTSQPAFQEARKEEEAETNPADNSFMGIFTSLIGGSKKNLSKASPAKGLKAQATEIDTRQTSQMEELKSD